MKLHHVPTITTLGIDTKELKIGIQTSIYMYIFTVALFIIVKRWKQSNCPSMAERINKLCYVHMMEFYSAIKSIKYLYMLLTKKNLETLC